jgi:hypothetical protein
MIRIYTLDLNGQNASRISTINRAWGVAVDGARLYFTEYTSDTLDVCDIANCDATRATLFDYGAGALVPRREAVSAFSASSSCGGSCR